MLEGMVSTIGGIVTSPTGVGALAGAAGVAHASSVAISSTANSIKDSIKQSQIMMANGMANNANSIKINEKQKDHIFRDSDGHLPSDTQPIDKNWGMWLITVTIILAKINTEMIGMPKLIQMELKLG